MKIDAHQHFWNFDPVRDSWINEEMSIIQRDFLPDELERILSTNAIDGCVAVQASQLEEETDFLVSLATANHFIKGVVGWIDLQADDIQKRLEYYKMIPQVKGFRHVLQGELQRDLMLQPKFIRGIAALHAANFTYDLLIFPDQITYAENLVSQFPQMKFVVDHIAKPFIKKGDIHTWKKDIEALARHQNVYCKISGMVTEADWWKWKQEDFEPYLDVVVEAFGTRRIMFGSDWPVCLVAATYEEMLGIVKDFFSSFTDNEQDRFFGLNAVDFYNL